MTKTRPAVLIISAETRVRAQQVLRGPARRVSGQWVRSRGAARVVARHQSSPCAFISRAHLTLVHVLLSHILYKQAMDMRIKLARAVYSGWIKLARSRDTNYPLGLPRK